MLIEKLKPIQFIGTTLKGPILVYPQDVVALTWLDKYQSTALIMAGGSSIPVEGTLSEVEHKITAAKAAPNQEGAN